MKYYSERETIKLLPERYRYKCTGMKDKIRLLVLWIPIIGFFYFMICPDHMIYMVSEKWKSYQGASIALLPLAIVITIGVLANIYKCK